MSEGEPSLLGGRRQQPLSEREQRTVFNTIVGVEPGAVAQYDGTRPTGFRPMEDDDGEIYGLITFNADIYPGPGVAGPRRVAVGDHPG